MLQVDHLHAVDDVGDHGTRPVDRHAEEVPGVPIQPLTADDPGPRRVGRVHDLQPGHAVGDGHQAAGERDPRGAVGCPRRPEERRPAIVGDVEDEEPGESIGGVQTRPVQGYGDDGARRGGVRPDDGRCGRIADVQDEPVPARGAMLEPLDHEARAHALQ